MKPQHLIFVLTLIVWALCQPPARGDYDPKNNFSVSGNFGLAGTRPPGAPLPDSARGKNDFGSGQMSMQVRVSKRVRRWNYSAEWTFLGRYPGERALKSVTTDSIIDSRSWFSDVKLMAGYRLLDRRNIALALGPAFHWYRIDQYLRTLDTSTRRTAVYIDYQLERWRPSLSAELGLEFLLIQRPRFSVPLFLRAGYDHYLLQNSIDRLDIKLGDRVEGARAFEFFVFDSRLWYRYLRCHSYGIGGTMFF